MGSGDSWSSSKTSKRGETENHHRKTVSSRQNPQSNDSEYGFGVYSRTTDIKKDPPTGSANEEWAAVFCLNRGQIPPVMR